jgi:hypothetical protein
MPLTTFVPKVNSRLSFSQLVIWWVPGIICKHIQPTINLARRLSTIQSKMSFGLVDKPPSSLLCVILGNPFANKRKRLNDSLDVELPIWWVSKRLASSDHQIQQTSLILERHKRSNAS